MAEEAVLTGAWLPEKWDFPLAMGLGVVITGYFGDTVAAFISGFVPAAWLNPVSELIIGIILFVIGGMGFAGGFSKWIRMFSFGAFAVGIADGITVLLGLGPTGAAARVVRVSSPTGVPYGRSAGVRTTPATRSNSGLRY